jgi:hypothetical protein
MGSEDLSAGRVRRGLHGVAYTVFEGVTPEPMQVEILGVLKDAIGPGQDMILARLKGEKPEYTGVVAGMSGSPVYIDGRLVGAMSYRIGQFSKEPICGITPIEQMLEVRDGQARGGVKLAGADKQGQKQIPFPPQRTNSSVGDPGFGNDNQRGTPQGGFGGWRRSAADRDGAGVWRVLAERGGRGLGTSFASWG